MLKKKCALLLSSLLLLIFLSLGCGRSSAYSYGNKENPTSTKSQEVDATKSGETLVNYIRRLPGVSVNRSGNELVAYVRGANDNVNANTAAQIYIDGTPVGNDINEVSSLISVDEIRRVEVVKDVSELSRYGMLGANGVILIKSRKN